MPEPVTRESAARGVLSAAALRVLALKPGEQALLAVEIADRPLSDYANVIVTARGFRQRFWVPTWLLRAVAASDQVVPATPGNL